MATPRWLLAFPLALASLLVAGESEAAAVRDTAGLFSREAVRQAESELDRVTAQTRMPVSIETIPSLNGESIDEVSYRLAEQSDPGGLFVLIAREESKISVRVS